MKNYIKLFSTVLSVLLIAALAGCTAAPAAEPTAAPTGQVQATPEPTAEAAASKLDKIKAAGKIVWGTNAEFIPFEMKDSAGQVIGVDADIAAKIAEALGVELVVEDMLFDSLPAALASGQIDFIGA
ncbi:MAG: transporter substrate-binding domain-containing protein, partial [Eubacteriales bacterium]|nr:transporter substrate-binding domain-containing protein [Eubacteriales bacterium]